MRGPIRSVSRPEYGAVSAPTPVLTDPITPIMVRLTPRSSMIADASTATANNENVEATIAEIKMTDNGPRRIAIRRP